MKKKIMRFLLMLCLLACAAPLAAQAQAPAGVLTVPQEGMVIVAGTYYGISKNWFQENNPDRETVSVSVTIPSDVTAIANDGLRDSYSSDKKRYGAVTYNDDLGRYNLAAVDFSQAVNLKTINNQAAMSCTALTGVLDLSRTKIETLGKSAFSGCTGIEGVILPETLKSIGSKDAGSVFRSCSGLKFVRTAGGDPQATFELPKQLEVIGRQSFYKCTGLPAGTAVTIPASVTYVGSEAFYHTDPITTITVETDDASAYDGGAFKGKNHGLGKRLVVFRNAAAKNTFRASGLSSYKNAITYEFLLHYGDARTEPKLYGQAVNVCKTDGRWSVEENYMLPKAEITGVPMGYIGGWAYNDALLTPNTVLRPAGDEFSLEVRKVLMNPTVEFIVDGETRASESSTLKLSLTNDREHTIGVRVSHPIETAPDADVKVKFEYQWTDVWKGGSQGPRMKEEGFGRYNLWDKPGVTNTISIDGPEDERTWQQKYSREDYGDGYYLVEIYGYSVPKSGGQWKLFYKSASTAIASDPQRTVNTAYVFDVITSGPPLLTLRNVSVSNVTESTAEITAETAAGAKVYYLSGAAAPDAAAIKAGGAFVTADAAGQVRIPLTGLTPETDYTWYLVAELSGHTDSRVAQTSFKTSEPEYTITFDANGGELSEASSARTVGGRLASLPVPVRGGHTFAGWRTEGGAEVTTDTVFTADATVYARWLSADAGVRAVAVDGTTGAILGTEIMVVLPEGTPLPTDPRKVSVTPAAGATASVPVSTDGGATWTFTVTAEDGVTTERYVIHVSVAEPAMCTITFEPNGGSGTMSPVVIPAGTYPLPPCRFTAQRGYRFKGWRLNEVEYGPGGTFSLTGDVTLTALWEKIPGEAPVFIFPDGPQEVVAAPGEHGVMIVEAEGAVTYQWFVNRHDGQGYRRIPGATDPIYTTRAVKLEHDGFTYRCVATNAHGTAHSPVFTLRVREADLPPRTGDESRTGLWLALMLASLAALAALGWRWRRDGGNR